MAIKQRGKSWQVDVKYKGVRVFRKSYKTEEYARYVEQTALSQCAAASKLGTEITKLEFPPEPSVKLGDLFTLERSLIRCFDARWEECAVAPVKLRHIELLQGYFPQGILLSQITTMMVNDLRTQLKRDRGICGRTVNKWIETLAGAYSHAAEEGYTGHVPKFTRDTSIGSRDKFYSKEEERIILKWFRVNAKPCYYHYHAIMFDTGTRVSELSKIDIRTSIVETQDGTSCLTLKGKTTKTKRGRTLLLSKRAQGIIHYYKERGINQPFLVCNPSNLHALWKRMREDLGITDPDFVAHSIRHTVATRLLNSGADFRAVMDWMGFSMAKMLEIYGHVTGGSKVQNLKAIEDSHTLADSVEIH